MSDGLSNADDVSVYYDPRTILAQLIRSEEAEIHLYTELARLAPTEQLSRTIARMAQYEREEVQRLRNLCDYYQADSFSDATHAVAECRDFMTGATQARNIEVEQIMLLAQLACVTADPVVFREVLMLAKDEACEALFWNDIVLAYAENPNWPGYPMPGDPHDYPPGNPHWDYPYGDQPGYAPGYGHRYDPGHWPGYGWGPGYRGPGYWYEPGTGPGYGRGGYWNEPGWGSGWGFGPGWGRPGFGRRHPFARNGSPFGNPRNREQAK